MARKGWIKLHRKLLDCPELKGNANARSVWLELMLRTSHEPVRVVWRGQPVELGRGELIVSMRELADAAGVSYQNLRTVCRLFDKADMAKFNAEINATGTRVTLCNFDEYQGSDEDANAEANATLTQRQRNANAQKKKEKNEKKETPIGVSVGGEPPDPPKKLTVLDDLKLDAELLDIAKAEGRDAARELAKFSDHYRAKGKLLKDWRAGFRNWLRSDIGKPGAAARPMNGHANGGHAASASKWDDTQRRRQAERQCQNEGLNPHTDAGMTRVGQLIREIAGAQRHTA